MLKGSLLITLLVFIATCTFAKPGITPKYYGEALCNNPLYKCVKVQGGKSWQTMFPDEHDRDVVQRLNRSDTYLYAGRTIVIPKDLKNTSIFDISPFPLHIKKPNEKIIIVDQNRLAWGAYNREGSLIKWGPISSGRDFCKDINKGCRTRTGIFYVFHKKGKGCKSNVFPVGEGGSRMPYCMFFFKGYALHGSKEVFGRRASHGCVRMFTRDAEWLNKSFVEPATKEGHLGTKVVVQKLSEIMHATGDKKDVKKN